MEIWFVRHGETTANVNGTMQGQQDGELTNLGILQAKLVGLRLSKVNFDDIYCSDLGRTKQTLNEILPYHNGTNIIYEKKIREKSGGILEGRPISEVKRIAEKKNIPLRKFRPINGENWVDVYVRCHEFLNDLIVKYINPNYSNEKFEEFKLQHKNSMKVRQIKDDENVANILFHKSKSNNLEIDSNDIQLILKENKGGSDYYKHKHKHQKQNISFEKTEKLLTETAIIDKISIPFNGFQIEKSFKRILVLTHGGFIMETLNAIRTRKNQELRFINDAKNTALYVLKIFCEVCGNICSNSSKCKMYYDFLIINDISHLDFIINDE